MFNGTSVIMNIHDKIIHCIENQQPITFVKYGDGEHNCMIGQFGANCDRDNFTAKKRNHLIESLIYFNQFDTVYIGKWHHAEVYHHIEQNLLPGSNVNWANYHSLLFDNDDAENGFQDKIAICRAIKASKMKKIIVCNELLVKAHSLLNIDISIRVPLHNWYDTYLEEIKQNIKDNVKEGETLMLITCAGMGSKCLIGDIHKIYPSGIYLDYGSGLDFICTKRDSRGWNYSYDALYNAFLPLLPEDWNDTKYDDIYNIARVHMGTHLPK